MTMLRMTSTWKQATEPIPCARDPRCRGIEPAEFYFELDFGRAVHAVGFCKDRDAVICQTSPGMSHRPRPVDWP